MFEYAIGHYQRHLPSRRLCASWVFSVLSHIAAAVILYFNPALLQSGRYIWEPVFSPPPEITETKKNRDLGVGAMMKLPPPEELRKYLPDWNRPKPKERPPIVINIPRAVDEAPVPKPKPVAPVPSISTTLPKTLPTTTKPGLTPEEIAGMTKKPDLPPVPRPPSSEKPTQIPKGITDPAAAGTPAGKPTGTGSPGQGQGGAASDQGKVTQVGFDLNPSGVNLEDYALLVKDLIRSKWEIPSNLREYQGSVTITFTILKNGRVIGSKLQSSSGNDSFDTTALLALFYFASHPLPPLPPGFTADQLGAKLVFAYNERK